MWETLTASTPYLGTQIGELPNAIKSGVRPAIPEYLSEEKQALVSLLKVKLSFPFFLFLSLFFVSFSFLFLFFLIKKLNKQTEVLGC